MTQSASAVIGGSAGGPVFFDGAYLSPEQIDLIRQQLNEEIGRQQQQQQQMMKTTMSADAISLMYQQAAEPQLGSV